MRIYCVIDAATGAPIRWGTCAGIDFNIQAGAGQTVIDVWPPSEHHTWDGEAWVAP